MKTWKNNNGYIPLSVFLVWGVIASVTSVGLVETHKSGVLKQNGQKIWCKMQNKGADYCDAKYQ